MYFCSDYTETRGTTERLMNQSTRQVWKIIFQSNVNYTSILIRWKKNLKCLNYLIVVLLTSWCTIILHLTSLCPQFLYSFILYFPETQDYFRCFYWRNQSDRKGNYLLWLCNSHKALTLFVYFSRASRRCSAEMGDCENTWHPTANLFYC